jgi:hypothetical protein
MGKAAEKGRDINETLTDLGIDTDLPPEVAAQEAAASTTVAEEIDFDGDDYEGGDEEDGGDGGDDGDDDGGNEIGDEEEEEDKPRPRSKVRVVIPPPKKAQPFPDMRDDGDDGPPVMIPAPKPIRAIRPERAGNKKSGLAKGLAERAPGASKVKVFKREEGQRWFINDYTLADLSTFPDFESFLTRYVKNDHGPGEYDLVGVDSNNREMELGTVRLRGVPEKKESNTMAQLLQGVMDRTNEQNERYLSRMREALQPPPQQNPLELLNGVMTLQEKISGKADSETGGALAAAMQAIGASSDKTMQMMMAMMQQQQAAADRQNQLMMTLLAKPKEDDPVMRVLLLKLTEEKSSGGGALPIPPAPPSPTSGLAEILTAMAGFMGAVGGGGGDGEDEFKDFLKQWMLKQQNEGLSTKEMIQLVLSKDEKNGSDSFRQAVDNMAAIMNIANNVNRQQEGGPAAGFFDALAALFSNRDFAGSIANSIRSKMDTTTAAQRTQLEAERQRLELRHRMAQRQNALQTGVPNPGAPPLPQQQMPQQPMPQQPMPQQPMPQQQQFSPPGPRTIARTGRLPQLPSDTHEHVNGLATAEDEGQLVGRTVQLLIYFAEFEDWRPFSEQLLGFVRDGNKSGALEYLTAFFDGLSAIHLIDPTLAQKVVRTVGKHFDVVVKQMSDFGLSKDEEITSDSLMAASEEGESASNDEATS